MIGALLGGGCATKKYVRNTVAPVSGKLDQVAQQTNQQGQTLDQTRQSLDQTKQQQQKDESELSATNERAMTADTHAGQAMNRANEANTLAQQANQKATQVGQDLGTLRDQVANLDDYKQVSETTVLFKFGSDKLSSDAKQQLDQMVSNQNQYKRYFISVEGFTDRVGSTEYNEALSRRRADAVMAYLVAEHNIPVYRIHMVGLGKLKPADDARTRAARAKNRRVVVTLFSADQGAMAMGGNPAQWANSTPANTQQR
jgi:outer membrane protein OmpA-like peptidoglycan-associated protein